MATVQVRKTAEIVWNLGLERDGWGFDRDKEAYVVTKNMEDGSRKVMLYPLADMSHYILLTLSAEEVVQMDNQRPTQPPS